MKNFTVIFLCLALCCLQVGAQRRSRLNDAERRVENYEKEAAVLLAGFSSRLDSLRQNPDSAAADEGTLSPYLYRGGMKYVVKQFHACLEWVG